MGQHAFLSPSAAHRWLHCTAAPALESRVEDSGSTYAEEGTLAHAYCALKLKRFLHRDTREEEAEISELYDRYHTGEMDEYTDAYQAIVLEKYNTARALTRDARMLVETRLSFERYMPEAFGTADAVIIADGLMEVIDFKYGKGVKVSAWENPQMQIYALGAYEAYSDEYRIDRVRMTIVQPRIDNLSEFEMGVDDLLAWAENELKPKAREAFSGYGKQEPGDWCRFCRAKNLCRARRDKVLALEAFGGRLPEGAKGAENAPGPLLTDAEVADALTRGEQLVTWYNGLKEYALQACLNGKDIPGYKAVAGRSTRDWADLDAAFAALQERGIDEVLLWERKPVTVAGLEKAIGKKAFTEAAQGLVVTQPGKPTLVPATDKRPPYNAAQIAFGGENAVT